MLALTGCTGKIGGAVLAALLEQNLISTSELVICTSSNPEDVRFDALRKQGALIRHSNYDDPASMLKAFSGCEKLLLVSSQESRWISTTPLTDTEEKNIISQRLTLR
jgi:uncharacterized protein YbjT (DUF2867 family)